MLRCSAARRAPGSRLRSFRAYQQIGRRANGRLILIRRGTTCVGGACSSSRVGDTCATTSRRGEPKLDLGARYVRDDGVRATGAADGGVAVKTERSTAGEAMAAIDIDSAGSASRKAKAEPGVSDSSRNLVAQVPAAYCLLLCQNRSWTCLPKHAARLVRK